LAFAINEAHKRGLELHAWYNPYRAAVDNSIPLHPTHMGVELAEYAYKFGQYLWMDPGSEAVFFFFKNQSLIFSLTKNFSFFIGSKSYLQLNFRCCS